MPVFHSRCTPLSYPVAVNEESFTADGLVTMSVPSTGELVKLGGPFPNSGGRDGFQLKLLVCPGAPITFSLTLIKVCVPLNTSGLLKSTAKRKRLAASILFSVTVPAALIVPTVLNDWPGSGTVTAMLWLKVRSSV